MKPIFHLLAGPNGAGKSTLYENRVQPRFPEAEFVNADLLAWSWFGHPAVTPEETLKGQRLAEEMRAQLMQERKDLATESTFSHPSKLDLLRQARDLGYEIRVYHIHLRNADLSVSRVAQRVKEGGHPVPEDKIREGFARNQVLIREATQLADRAYIFDNSVFGKPHQRVLEFHEGKAVYVDQAIPHWTRELYSEQLRGYSLERLNRAAASFDVARQMTKSQIGEGANLFIARTNSGGQETRYLGPVIVETDLHLVQQVAHTSAVAHFKSKLNQTPMVGELVEISYRDGRGYAQVIPQKKSHMQEQKKWGALTPEERKKHLEKQLAERKSKSTGRKFRR